MSHKHELCVEFVWQPGIDRQLFKNSITFQDVEDTSFLSFCISNYVPEKPVFACGHPNTSESVFDTQM